jgi:hypothetical protein
MGGVYLNNDMNENACVGYQTSVDIIIHSSERVFAEDQRVKGEEGKPISKTDPF